MAKGQEHKDQVKLRLRDRVAESCIILGLEAGGPDEVLARLARDAQKCGLVSDHRPFFAKLKAREAEMSTGVGMGLAVPHAVVPAARNTFVVAATLRRPIDYRSIDGLPVDIVFLLGGKPGEIGIHLQLLARIIRLARQPEFLDQLRRQTTPAGFLAAVADAEQTLYPGE